jgi:TRAP-type C4-dicarboxylate transport system permease small subunit
MNTQSTPEIPNNKVLSVVNLVDKSIVAVSITVAIAALSVMFVSLLLEVIIRYFSNQGLGWPTELPSILFPWLVAAGIVLAAQQGQHIAVAALPSILKTANTRRLFLLLQVITAVTFYYLAWIGLQVVEITGAEVYPATGISARWAYLALIVCFIGLGITATTTFIKLWFAPNPFSVREPALEESL